MLHNINTTADDSVLPLCVSFNPPSSGLPRAMLQLRVKFPVLGGQPWSGYPDVRELTDVTGVKNLDELFLDLVL